MSVLLDGRPTDHYGRVIPWVAGWSSETWGVSRFDARLGRHALFTLGRPGRGRPVFGALNEVRQREAMLTGICQICGTLTTTEDRYVTDPAPGTIEGLPGMVITEPWAHGECMAYALTHCPALKDTDVIYRPRSGRLVLQIIDPSKAPAVKAGRFDPVSVDRLKVLAAEVRRHKGLVGYLRLLIIDADPIARPQFLETFA